MDVWRTMFAGGFNQDKYLYHYTGIDSAIKIICSGRLRFSTISKTNDTSEAKLKLVFDAPPGITDEEFRRRTEQIKGYFKAYQPNVRLLCLSRDAKISSHNYKKALAEMDPKMRYYDLMGRGFALPRMWAQYARDNTGICFILDKAALLAYVEKLFPVHMKDKVSYKHFYDSYRITAEHMEELSARISIGGNGALTLVNMLQRNKEFLKYNFFEKLNDWENEHEFRIIVLTDQQDTPIFVDSLSTYLRGVVMGEKIDPDYEKIITLLLRENDITCDIKKIYFESNCCRLN